VEGGVAATGTLTLNAAAPAGGASVQLSSSADELQVPSVVTVSAGSTSVTFPVVTLPSQNEIRASVIASYGGVSPWALVVVKPPGAARIEIVDGDGQSVAAGSLVPLRFKVRVLDGANNGLRGSAVRFTAPSSGASGSFGDGSPNIVITTDSSGIASAPAFVTNATAGQFLVLASTDGVAQPAAFTVQATTTALATPSSLVATAISATTITLGWNNVAAASMYEIFRSARGNAYSRIGTAGTNTISDPTATTGTAYLYAVRAVDASGSPSPLSAPDLATTIVFTDPTLAPGTLIKAVHFSELRSAVSAVRTLAGLEPYPFTDAGVIPQEAAMKGIDIVDLRGAIDGARAALALPPAVYSDPLLASGYPIRAVQVNDLRAAVK
jgi:hypothetical protein